MAMVSQETSFLLPVKNRITVEEINPKPIPCPMDPEIGIAISIIADTPAFVSALVSAAALDLSHDLSIFKIDTKNEICTFVDTAVVPLRYIVGLSTLNYYTWIGDDINKLSNDPKYPELSLISNDVIWFDTSSDDSLVTKNEINQLKNLQL